MKLVANLLILMALVSIVVGVITKFCGIIILFPDIAAMSYIHIANTFLLLALVLKLASE